MQGRTQCRTEPRAKQTAGGVAAAGSSAAAAELGVRRLPFGGCRSQMGFAMETGVEDHPDVM